MSASFLQLWKAPYLLTNAGKNHQKCCVKCRKENRDDNEGNIADDWSSIWEWVQCRCTIVSEGVKPSFHCCLILFLLLIEFFFWNWKFLFNEKWIWVKNIMKEINRAKRDLLSESWKKLWAHIMNYLSDYAIFEKYFN
jgi:hypothetical protein